MCCTRALRVKVYAECMYLRVVSVVVMCFPAINACYAGGITCSMRAYCMCVLYAVRACSVEVKLKTLDLSRLERQSVSRYATKQIEVLRKKHKPV